MKFLYLKSKGELIKALGELRGDYLFLYRDKLLGLSDGKFSLLIEPLVWQRFREIIEGFLRERGIVGYDLKEFLKGLNFRPYACFDLLLASHFLGEEEKSLEALSQKYCNLKIPKVLAFSNLLNEKILETHSIALKAISCLFEKLLKAINGTSDKKVWDFPPLDKSRVYKIFKLENPSALVDMASLLEVVEVEKNGIPVDAKLLKEDSTFKEFIKGGRIYTHFELTTKTGRIYSKNPNVQNVPKALRRFFKPKEGNLFVICDYSQVELRIFAEIYKEEEMIKAFKEGKDLHSYTSELLKVDRNLAKTLNFALIYGASRERLRELLGGKEEPLKVLYSLFPNLFKRQKILGERIRREGFLRAYSLLGRPLLCKTLNDAINYPIQSSGAELLKLALLLFSREVRRQKLRAKVVNLIHDELMVECPREEAEETKRLLKKAMEEAGKIMFKKVPIVSDCKVCPRWC